MHFFYFDINLKFLIASITIENPNIRVTEIEALYPLEKNIQEVIIVLIKNGLTQHKVRSLM